MKIMESALCDQLTGIVGIGSNRPERQAVIVVVEDGIDCTTAVQEICDYLDLEIERLSSHDDLGPVLRKRRPMAVIAELEAAGQDGCHVMKIVAGHDDSLPVLLLTGGDPALAGAADAVEEIWGLSSVTKSISLPALGEVVHFLFRAGLSGHCMGLIPT